MRVYVDPGHGGSDPGAMSPKGLREADVTLAIGRRVNRSLMIGEFQSMLGRTHDTTMSLRERCERATQWGAELFLSIHCNGAVSPDAHGFEVWTSPGKTLADTHAESIFESIQSAFPLAKARFDLADGDHDKEARFYVLVHTPMPAVLVEVGFITHQPSADLMGDQDWLDRMARAIARGVRRC